MIKLLFLLIFVVLVLLVVAAVAGYISKHRPRRVPEKEQPKAIDYSPDSVLDWSDIQWTVEKKLPKEGR